MNKIAFSTDALPPQFDDRARLSEWRDFLERVFGRIEVSALPDRPFTQRLEVTQFGSVLLAQLAGNTDRFFTSSAVASALRPDFFLCLRSEPGPSPISFSQRGREVTFDSATAVLATCNDAMDLRVGDRNRFLQLAVPQARLEELVAGLEDLVARPLDSRSPAMLHLNRFLTLLAATGEAGNDPDLAVHIETTLVDLMALALGATRDAGEIARMRGLRAARLQDILSNIRAGFAEPDFSPDDIARKLGVTPRYVQTLLQEAGSTFTERVLELRLQRARSMLSNPGSDRMKISEISEACGFSEVSYFNRCFRRRFGLTPTAARGRSEPW